MKLLLLIYLLFTPISTLFASLTSKSAMVYYGEEISYSMVGIHEYIIVQSYLTNTNTHGFSLYKDQMYAYISIGEIDRTLDIYKDVKKEWIVAQNKAWQSDVLDLKSKEYQNFMFEKMIEPARKKGFKNFFFDTLDSYEFYSKTQKQRIENRVALVSFIKEFHTRYPDSKLILNRGFNIIDEVHEIVQAVLFESYYKGISGEQLVYKSVSKNDRQWLDIYIKKIKEYGLDIICLDYLDFRKPKETLELVKKIAKTGMIPYVSTRDLTSYGVSSKNAIKREVFTLVDESKLDIMDQGSIVNTGVVFEYMGYMQKFHDINKGLPSPKKMLHYAGVVIWLQNDYKQAKKLLDWVLELKKIGIKVVFVNSFGFAASETLLQPLGIKVSVNTIPKKGIKHSDSMMGYEIDPPMSLSSLKIRSEHTKALLQYEFIDGSISTSAAITPWGGYALRDAFISTIGKDNIWIINPFSFFKEALGLKELVVPDTTTHNAKRVFFTHIDGDGIMNRVEGDFGYYSGDVILNKILKVYKVPHSVSLIGAEIAPTGLYPKLSPALLEIAQEMYALENVEPATHTFTHPFYWGKIKNNNLNKNYRLKPKDYNFSLENEFSGTLEYLETALHPKRAARTVFWTGDCIPRINALSYIYEHNILNINGGDTTITKLTPWLSAIAPMGLQRGEYTQVFTGAQNENVFTNDWLGPFWGFKRVTQTFELTGYPNRYKPIDIYYHIYSGSKQASVRALEYVFDWALSQDIIPLFTSEYIPKVMDYYSVSIAHEGNKWLFCGMNSLKTLRVEKVGTEVSLGNSKTVLGFKKEKKRTYISLDKGSSHIVDISKNLQKSPYLISSNAYNVELTHSQNTKNFHFDSYIDLEVELYIYKACKLISEPTFSTSIQDKNKLLLKYKDIKSVDVRVECP